MRYDLRDGISYCEVAGRLVFLDCQADRYFCLDEAAEMAFRALARSDQGTERSAAAAPLIATGLVAPAAHALGLRPCTAPAKPVTSLCDGRGYATFRQTLRAALALVASMARLRLRPFAANLASSASRSDGDRDHRPRATLETISAAFAGAAIWLSVRNRCLPQSLAVARVARAAGFDVQLVFGVSLGPFEAHCWVQHGDTVVNDRVEVVRRFVPVLVC